jgi:hypothetical protein
MNVLLNLPFSNLILPSIIGFSPSYLKDLGQDPYKQWSETLVLGNLIQKEPYHIVTLMFSNTSSACKKLLSVEILKIVTGSHQQNAYQNESFHIFKEIKRPKIFWSSRLINNMLLTSWISRLAGF